MKLGDKQKIILRKIGFILLPKVFTVLCKTLKIEYENKEVFDALTKEKNCVIAFWHSKMAVGWYLLLGRKPAAIVSASKDGEILSILLTSWGFKLARGSSSKGGKDAMETLLQFTADGFNIAITPDGPTGPPNKMKAGAVITAKKSGTTLLLVGIAYSKYWELNSWDKMKIPKPFAKVKVIFSEPKKIDKDLSYDETSFLIEEYEKELNELNKKAEEIVGTN